MRKSFYVSEALIMATATGGTSIGPVCKELTEAEFWQKMVALAGESTNENRHKIEDHLETPGNVVNIGALEFSFYN